MCNGKPVPITCSHYRNTKFLLHWIKPVEQRAVDKSGCYQRKVKKRWKEQYGINFICLKSFHVLETEMILKVAGAIPVEEYLDR